MLNEENKYMCVAYTILMNSKQIFAYKLHRQKNGWQLLLHITFQCMYVDLRFNLIEVETGKRLFKHYPMG